MSRLVSIKDFPPDIQKRLAAANLNAHEVRSITVTNDVTGLPPLITVEIYEPLDVNAIMAGIPLDTLDATQTRNITIP